MLEYAAAKVDKLKSRGFDQAMVYDPAGVGGLHMMYVVPRGEMLSDYGLPEDPQVPGTFFSALGVLRKLGSVSVWGGAIATAIFWLRTGRRRPPPEEEAVAEAHRMGAEAEPAAPEPAPSNPGPDEGGER
jgi:formate dehydrogenase iron-sulfur subunit